MGGNQSVKWWRRRAVLWMATGLLVLLVTSCGMARSPATPAVAPTSSDRSTASGAAPVVIVAVGDSLTEGFGVEPEDAYPAQLERKLRADGHDITVVNAGNSGETSSGARSRIDWVLTLNPDIVILATGGNDGLRGISTAVTAENLDALIGQFQAAGAIVVVAGMEMVQNMGAEYTSAFRALYPAAAHAHDAILIPFLLEGVAADPAHNQSDFIHPTGDGYAVVVETIYPYVLEALGQLDAESVARE